MLGFVSNMLGPRANPIGIDFGTETLRLVQVATANGEHKVIAAASVDVPGHIRNDAQARLGFLTSSLRELLVGSQFRGRQVIVGLPAAALSMVHVRVPVMDEAALLKAVPLEARGKLPYDPTHAVVRHIIAGEVYHGQDRKLEAIVLASPRAIVESLLAAVGKAKLDVVGMNVEPLALMDCFATQARRKDYQETTVMYVDIGASGTRAIISRAGQIMFARGISIGGDQFTRAVGQLSKVGFDDARLMRMRVAEAVAEMPVTAPPLPVAESDSRSRQLEAEVDEAANEPSEENSFALLGAGLGQRAVATAAPQTATVAARPATTAVPPPLPAAVAEVGVASSAVALESRRVETAVREPLGRLVEELNMCRRYHDATFPNAPVGRVVFVGGEARHRDLCAFIARDIGLPACVGDPMARMSRVSEALAPECGLDRRGVQPSWAVALGLSVGKVAVRA